jgi:hypothetical protein
MHSVSFSAIRRSAPFAWQYRVRKNAPGFAAGIWISADIQEWIVNRFLA